MYRGQTVGVVVPAYNEEDHVGTVIETMPAFVDRIYVVDDGSTDDTWARILEHVRRIDGEATEAGALDDEPDLSPRVVPVRHEANRGAGAAVKTGYSLALEDGIEVTAVMDGDGQMDPEELERIIDPVVSGEVTYAKGNRLRFRQDYERMSGWRLFGNVILTSLTRVSSGYWEVSDPQNGFTAISREGLETIQFDRLYDGYGFLNDLLHSLNLNREPIADVSHPAIYADETSGIRYSSFVPKVSMLLARNFLERLGHSYVVQRLHPTVISLALGVIALFTGISGGAYAVASPGVDSFLGGMTSAAVGVLGGVLLTLGAWFDVSENEGLVTDVDGSRALQSGTDVADSDRTGTVAEPIRDGGTIEGQSGVENRR